MNGLVVTMAYVAPRIHLSVANHATPGHTPGLGVGIKEPVVLGLRETAWIREETITVTPECPSVLRKHEAYYHPHG